MLDEPTAGLDPDQRRGLRRAADGPAPAARLTVIMITHDLDTIFRTCNRVGVIIDRKMTSDTLEGITRQSTSVDPGLFPRRARPALRPGQRNRHHMEREANYTAVGAFVLLIVTMAGAVRLLVRRQRRRPRLQALRDLLRGQRLGTQPRQHGALPGRRGRAAWSPSASTSAPRIACRSSPTSIRRRRSPRRRWRRCRCRA